MPVDVDAGGDQHDRVDHATLSSDLHRQRIGRYEGERRGLAQDRVRNAVTCSSRSAAIRDTCDFDSDVIPSVCTSLSIRRVDKPSR